MKMKKILATLIATAMMISCLPVMVYADDDNSGTDAPDEIILDEETTPGEQTPEDGVTPESPSDEEASSDTDEITDESTDSFEALDASAGTEVNNENDLRAAVNGDIESISLSGDIVLTQRLTVPANYNGTIDLNGHTLSRSLSSAASNGNVVYVSGTLTIMNGTITGGYSEQGGGIYNAGNLTVNNCSITNNISNDAGGIYNKANASLTINSSTISNNTSVNHGGGGIVNYGSVQMIDSSVTGNTSKSNGGGIWNNSVLTLGGRIVVSDNSSTDTINNNLFLKQGQLINIGSPITAGSSIYISCESYTHPATSGWSTYSQESASADSIFHADNTDYTAVAGSDGEIWIQAYIPYIYRSWNARTQSVVDEPRNYTGVIYDVTGTQLNEGWYYVTASRTISGRITVSGTVNVIIPDGITLTCSEGIYVPQGSTLNIYGQENDTGKIIATGNDYNAGIGGNKDEEASSGSVNIFGGTIIASGGSRAAGIGGTYEGAGNVTIYGGTVTATGGNLGAGIGGGYDSSSFGSIKIYGGYIEAEGGNEGAGIGGGRGNISNGSIEIFGGMVDASGGRGAAGIGSGQTGNVGSYVTITIHGGVVYAEGGEPDSSGVGSAGIGAGAYGYMSGGGDFRGSILIDGGTVTAKGSGTTREDEGTWSNAGGAGIGAACGGNMTGVINIIEDAGVTALGGAGGAAIGAGARGLYLDGADCTGIIRLGSEIHLALTIYSGTSYNTSFFIGHGDSGSANGSLDLDDEIMVYFDGEIPCAAGERINTCRSSRTASTILKIEPCTHRHFTYSITPDTHTLVCSYCNHRDIAEVHTFHDGTCSVCGYNAEQTCYVSFDSGDHGTGTMENAEAAANSLFRLPECSFTPDTGYVFSGWRKTDGAEIHSPGTSIYIDGDTTLVAVWTEIAFDGHAMQLSGVIGLQFFMRVPSAASTHMTSAYVTFSGNHVDSTVHYSLTPSTKPNEANGVTDPYYMVQINISSIMMAEPITPTFHYKSTNGEWYEFTGTPYSAQEYIEYGLEHITDEQTLQILSTLGDYGHYSQPYLSRINRWTVGTDYAEATYNSGYDYSAHYSDVISYVESHNLQAHFDSDNPYFSTAAYSLRFGDYVSLSVLLTPAESVEIDPYLLDTIGEVTVLADGRYLIVYSEIPAWKINTMYNIRYNNEVILSVCPLSYAYSMINSSSTGSDGKDLISVLFRFARACGLPE